MCKTRINGLFHSQRQLKDWIITWTTIVCRKKAVGLRAVITREYGWTKTRSEKELISSPVIHPLSSNYLLIFANTHVLTARGNTDDGRKQSIVSTPRSSVTGIWLQTTKTTFPQPSRLHKHINFGSFQWLILLKWCHSGFKSVWLDKWSSLTLPSQPQGHDI